MNNRLIDNFFKLVQIDSPTGEEDRIAEFVLDLLLKNKLVDHAQRDKFGNIYARKDGVGEPIFLSDHLDTVEPGRGIKPQIKNGYVISGGDTILGADDKSSVSALIEALFIIKEENRSTRPLEIIFTTSEEVGNLGAVNFDYSLLAAKKGFCFDCTQPLGVIVTASPFYERFDIEIKGKEAHASRPELGINVLSILGELIDKQPFGKLDENTVFNIGVVNGGYVRNAIPGNLVLKGEIRSFKEQTLIKYKNKFLRILEQVISKSGASYEIEFVRENPGFKYSLKQEHEVIDIVEPHLKKLKIKPVLSPNWGVSDTNIFFEKGLFCINMGGGREFAHTTRERIKVTELEKLVKLILEIVK